MGINNLACFTCSNNFTVKFPVPGPISKTVSVERKPACNKKKSHICKQFHEAGCSPTCMFYSYIILWNTLYSTKINDVRIEHRAVTIKGSVDGQCEHDPQILS